MRYARNNKAIWRPVSLMRPFETAHIRTTTAVPCTWYAYVLLTCTEYFNEYVCRVAKQNRGLYQRRVDLSINLSGSIQGSHEP